MQRARITALGVLAPMFERCERMHPLGDAPLVERADRLVVDEHVLAARLVLELGNLGDEVPVVCEERALRRKRARHQRFANEDLARDPRIDAAVRHGAARDERDPVELHALARDNLAAIGIPMRLEVLTRYAFAGDVLDPFGLHGACATREQPRRLDQFGGEHPPRPLLREPRAWMQIKSNAPRALIRVAFALLRSDVSEETRQQRLMERAVFRRAL